MLAPDVEKSSKVYFYYSTKTVLNRLLGRRLIVALVGLYLQLSFFIIAYRQLLNAYLLFHTMLSSSTIFYLLEAERKCQKLL